MKFPQAVCRISCSQSSVYDHDRGQTDGQDENRMRLAASCWLKHTKLVHVYSLIDFKSFNNYHKLLC